MKKVSIVLPVYNGEKYISESIESVINQTYKNWELIIVDDCSTDNSLRIAEKYSKGDDRIRIIHNIENKKLPASLNIGFKASDGEYLTWTSDDNIYLPNALQVMLDMLEENPKNVMVCADMDIIDDDGNKVGKKNVGKSKLCLNNVVGACFMYRRCVLDRVGVYDTSQFLIEDYDYWIRIEKEYGSILFINECLYQYRYHKNSLSIKNKHIVDVVRANFRERNKEYILSKLGVDFEDLFIILYDNYSCGKSELSINKEILKYNSVADGLFDPITIDQAYLEKVVVFGAGDYGRQFAENTEKDILFFVDNDVRKIGSYVSGYIVNSVESIRGLRDDEYVIIAVSSSNMVSIIKQIYKMGYRRVAVAFYQ